MSLNIFVLYRRDIHETDSGASRTVILVNNYLAAQKDIIVYTSYKHLSSVDHRIIEIPITEDLSVKAISKVIREKNIAVLLIPEGEHLAHIGRLAANGTNCKVITEFHCEPGYEILRLYSSVIHYLHNGNLLIKIICIIKIILFPVYKYLHKTKHKKRFQQAYLDADKFVVLSHSIIEKYESIYSLKENKKTVVIGNALSFKNDIDINNMKKTNTILVVSRLDEAHKRISCIIKAWEKIYNKYPNWNLQIIGTGKDEYLYQKMITRKKLKNIYLLGHQNPESFYEKASVFLMTSTYEGLPMTLVEALQKGCVPIVMDSFSSVHDIIADKIDGFIVPNNDINSFVNKIELLIDSPEIRMSMATKGVLNSNHFSMNTVGQQWLKLLYDVINE